MNRLSSLVTYRRCTHRLWIAFLGAFIGLLLAHISLGQAEVKKAADSKQQLSRQSEDPRYFATKLLPTRPDYAAPDGSDVRVLVRGNRGSMAHFELAAGHTSTAVAHKTVEEIWYFLDGRGEMWRKLGDKEEIIDVCSGVSITIPKGTHFQFRSVGDDALTAVAVTMPPWPSREEAYRISGKWRVTQNAPN